MAEAKKKRRAPRKKTTTGKGVRKVPTGIPGLDEALDGGLPAGRVTLIAGPSGAGKTVFLNEFVYRGIVEQ
ncbi:MAG TPA: ATPase domain-containing protein, partial [Gammaproteobacteria bacterium]|nr:ATPase domain-containing protein [Gammaproteobacteria bacterium]